MEPMTIADIIKASHEGKPIDVANAFNDVIQAKMAAALDARKEELANSLYGSDEHDDDDSEESDVDADDDQEYEDLDIEDQTDEDL